MQWTYQVNRRISKRKQRSFLEADLKEMEVSSISCDAGLVCRAAMRESLATTDQ